MLELWRPTRRKNWALRSILQESTTDTAIIIFYVVQWMLHKYDANVAVRIFYPQIGYQSHLYLYFFDVASVDF